MTTVLKAQKNGVLEKQFNAVAVGEFSCEIREGRVSAQTAGGQFVIRVGMTRGEETDKLIRSACEDIAKFAVVNKCKSVLINANSFCNEEIGLSQVANAFLDELDGNSIYDGLNAVVAVDFGGKELKVGQKRKYKSRINSFDKCTTVITGNLNSITTGTGEVEVSLSYDDSLRGRFKAFQEQSDCNANFKDYLLNLIEAKGIEKFSNLYRAAGITKDTFSKILDYSKTRKPSKETVAALTIGLKLNLTEAQEFYQMAGYSLTSWDFVDKLIRFCISERIYDIDTVNSLYCEETGRLLGSNVRKDGTVQL